MNLYPIPEAAKAYVALVGAVATALLGVYGPQTPVGHWLTVIVAVATAVATFAVPNRPKTAGPAHSRDETGAIHIDVGFIIAVAVAVFLAWVLIQVAQLVVR